MFLGWYDPDKKKPAREKLAEAIERHVEKFGAQPELCLTNAAEAAELAGEAVEEANREAREAASAG